MDVEKHVEHWRLGSVDEIEVADIVAEKGKHRQALFHAHLSVEKLLKAHVTKKTCAVPPRIHNLARLAKLADLDLPTGMREFLAGFDRYQILGRYDEGLSMPISRHTAESEISGAKEVLEWLTARL